MQPTVEIVKDNNVYLFFDSAIRYYNLETKDWHIAFGKRHSDIIRKLADAGLTESYKTGHIDGFLCIINGYIQFIDRGTATNIAKAANYPMIGSVLTSEDLW